MRVVLSGQERIMNAVKTDVIIPAYHPGEEFDKLLERLSAQKYPVNKIIVMNTEKKFWRENWEQKYPLVEVHHLTKQEFDHGATRRRGAELSDAEILIFMTQDALPADRNLVGNLVQAVAGNEKTGAAYARQLPKNDCGFLEKYTRSFNYPEQSCLKTEKDVETRGIKTYFCSNVCAAYDHRIYNEIGGFPEHAIFNEDMIYAGWMVKKVMRLLMQQRLRFITLIITAAASSFTEILILAFPRQSIRKFLKEFRLRGRECAW